MVVTQTLHRRHALSRARGPYADTAVVTLTDADEQLRAGALLRIRALHHAGVVLSAQLVTLLQDRLGWWDKRLDDLRFECRLMRESRTPAERSRHYDAAMSARDGARIWARSVIDVLDRLEDTTMIGGA